MCLPHLSSRLSLPTRSGCMQVHGRQWPSASRVQMPMWVGWNKQMIASAASVSSSAMNALPHAAIGKAEKGDRHTKDPNRRRKQLGEPNYICGRERSESSWRRPYFTSTLLPAIHTVSYTRTHTHSPRLQRQLCQHLSRPWTLGADGGKLELAGGVSAAPNTCTPERYHAF